MVWIRRVGSWRSHAALMRLRLPVPATFTHRSRGNERIAAWLVVGSTRRMMIASLRSPIEERSPNAPAYGELGSTQALLSAPVRRKLSALTSPGGTRTGATVVPVAAVPAVVVAGMVVAEGVAASAVGMITRLVSPSVWLPYQTRTAARRQPIATIELKTRTRYCGTVRRGWEAPTGTGSGTGAGTGVSATARTPVAAAAVVAPLAAAGANSSPGGGSTA